MGSDPISSVSSVQPDRAGARGIGVAPAAGNTGSIAAFTAFTDDHCGPVGTEFHIVSEREVGGSVRMVVRFDHVVQIPPVVVVPVDIDCAGSRLAGIQRRRARPISKSVVPWISNREDRSVATDRDALAKEAASVIGPPGARCQRKLLLIDALLSLEHLDFRRPLLSR